MEQISGFARILIRAKVHGRALRFGRGGDSRAGHHFRNELHALAMIVAREILRDGFFEKSVGAFRYATRRLSCGWVAIDFASRRIGSLLVYTGLPKRERIRVCGVTASVLDVHGMVRNRG